jgi:hypothetical protein
MPKSKKARKKPYRHEASTKINRFAWADRLDEMHSHAQPVDVIASTTVLEQARGALNQLRRGTATCDQVNSIVGQHTVAVVLCNADFMGSMAYADDVDAAGHVLHELGKRALKSGVWQLSEQEADLVQVLIDIREAQITHEENTVGLEVRAMRKASEMALAGEIFSAVKRGVVHA